MGKLVGDESRKRDNRKEGVQRVQGGLVERRN